MHLVFSSLHGKLNIGKEYTTMKRGGLEAARVVVLTANITLQRGGIWNLGFKHHGKKLKSWQRLTYNGPPR